MTRTELILKFSEKYSVEQTDSKVFFELLLKKIASSIRVGQTISIPELGYFHRIKGKIRKPSLYYNTDEISEEKIDLLLYSEEKKLGQSEAKGFVFNIPFTDDEDYHPVDSYFSLSIGKPLIPLRGTMLYDEFIPTSEYEFKNLLQSKVDYILKNAAIDFSDEEFPTLVIDASSYTTNEIKLERAEEDLEKILSEDDRISDDIKDSTEVSNSQNIAWDFGEYFSGKISAESIIELTNEKIATSESHNLTSNAGEKDVSNEENKIENILDELLEHEVDNNIKEESIDRKFDSAEDPERLLDELDEYEEVKFENSENYLSDDQSEVEFWKSASKLFETYDPREFRHNDADSFTEVKSTSLNLDEKSSERNNIILADDETTRPATDYRKNDEVVFQLEKLTNSKKWIYAVLSLIIILAALVTYWYTQIYIKSKKLPTKTELKLNTTNSNIVSRDFSIPVSYPYDRSEIIKESSITESKDKSEELNKSGIEDSPVKIESDNTLKNQNQSENIYKNFVPTERPVNIGDNIYRYGNIYFVQVASFKSNSIAENEAGKYRNKGYNSFVEATEIPERGTWYRIKVGNFSSLDEAKKFKEKNIR